MSLMDIVHAQAEDEGLWFVAQYASEAYLQQELRRLHAAIEAMSDTVPQASAPMRIWIDTEFNEHANRHELISMGLVAESGQEWYRVLPCSYPGPWVMENVMPKLGSVPISHEQFSLDLREFLSQWDAIHVIGDWPADIALFCDALIVGPGCRIDTPTLTLEVIRLDGGSADPHNALADARGIRDAHIASQAPTDTDMIAVCAALGFDPTNHHNAAKCPYCASQAPAAIGEPTSPGVSPSADAPPARQADDALRDAVRRLFPLIERSMKGFVFTAAKAGEVGADMQTLRDAALASQPAAEPRDAILARMVVLAPYTSFLGAYENEWRELIASAAEPPSSQSEP